MWHNWQVYPSWAGVVSSAHVLVAYVCCLPLASAHYPSLHCWPWNSHLAQLCALWETKPSSGLCSQLSACKLKCLEGSHTSAASRHSLLEGIKKQVLCVLKLYVETDLEKLSVSSHCMKNQVAVSWKMNWDLKFLIQTQRSSCVHISDKKDKYG